MRDRRSKNHEETSVSDRTRSKRHASRYTYIDRSGLDGTSVPHKCREQRKWNRTNSDNKSYMDDGSGIERISEAEFRNNRTNSTSKRARTYSQGNEYTYIDKENGIERITEAEFKNKRTNSTLQHPRTYTQGNNNENLNMWRFDETDFRRKETNPTSKDAGNHAQGIKGVLWEDCRKEENYPSSEVSATFSIFHGNKNQDMDLENSEIEIIDVEEFRRKTKNGVHRRLFSHENASQVFHKEHFNHTGHDVDQSSEEEVEIIDQSEFMECKRHYVANKGPSTKEKSNEGNSGSTCTCHGSDQEGSGKSNSFLRRGNNNEDANSNKDEIERIDDFMFRNEDSGQRGKCNRNCNYDCDDDIVDNNEEEEKQEEERQKDEHQTHHELPLKFRFEEESETVEKSDYESTMENMLEELERFNSPEVDQENAPAEENQHEQCTRGNHEFVLEIDQGEFCVYCGHGHPGPKDVLPLSVANGYCESDESRTHEFTYAEKGKNEDSDKKIHRMRKMIPDETRIKRGGVSSYSRKEENKDLNGCLGHAINNSSDQCMTPESNSHLNNLGIASRTRSKMGTKKRLSEVCPDSNDDSDSSNDSEFSSSDDEFKLIKSSNSNSEKIECAKPDTGNCIFMGDSERSGHCYKHGRSAAKHGSKRRNLTENQNETTSCNMHGVQRQKNSEGKMQASNPQLIKSSNSDSGKIECAKADTGNCILMRDSERSGRSYKHGRSAAKHGSKRRGLTEHLNETTSCNLHGVQGQQNSEGKMQASNPQLNCDEIVGDGRMLTKDQSKAGKSFLNNSVPRPPSNEGFDRNDGHKNNYGIGKIMKDLKGQVTKKQMKGPKSFSKQYTVFNMLSDSILKKDQMLGGNNTKDNHPDDPQAPNALPLRFKFEEEQKEVAKSENENMQESLFSELEFCLASEEVGSFHCPEDDLENAPAEETTQHERCARGKHQLILEDDQGLLCVYCGHVALGPKYILPEWGKYKSEPEKRSWSASEDLPDFDAFSSQFPPDDYVGLSSSTNGTVWSLTPGVWESMYEHQQEGFEFLWRNLAGSINLAELKSTNPSGVGGCIISHAPGTGKTRLTIVFMETYLKMFPNCLPVIIAPASMLLTWEEEFRKWNVVFPFHNLSNLEFSGKENKSALGLLTGARRDNQDTIRMVKIYSWNTGSSILGISYNLFEKLTGEKYRNDKRKKGNKDSVLTNKKVESLRKILIEKPGLVVLDEGHTPRNDKSNIWNVLQKIKTEKRVILSGTPFQNNFAELLNTLRIVRPAVADTLAQERPFVEMNTSRRVFSEVIDQAVEKLKIAMSPFVHVHKGTILQQSLPGLRDCVLLLKPSALQKRIIERLEGLQSTFKFEHEVALTSVHPYLFKHCHSTEEQRVGINMEAVEASKLNPNEGVKTKFVVEFVRLSVAMNEKVLIFSQYIQPLELIKELMKEVFKWTEGKQILQMQGKLDQKQRQILINLFNDPQSESKIMLASTKCCSEGISLVGASRVILLDVVWNPSVERQAICRAYRIGQKKFVHTYHLMTCGTTEADKYCRQAEKERLSELVFSSVNESNLQKQNLTGFEDRILEEMVSHAKLQEMFEKIINQPKDTNLIHSFGLTT